MIIYKIAFNNTIIEFNTLVNAEAFAMQNNIPLNLIEQENREASVDLAALINEALIQKQNRSLQLLREIFVQNTLQGISTSQSKELFKLHGNIILCILVGAYPTAYSMLNEVEPSGFLTQERINEWKLILEQYL